METRRATAFLLTTAVAIAAGCMVIEHARINEPGGGTGIKFIDGPLDSFTALEGSLGAKIHGGFKSADKAAAGTWHFATGLVAPRVGPSLAPLQKARRAEQKRRVDRPEVIKRVEKARVSIDAPLLESDTLDKLGLYLVWETVLADVAVRNVWPEGDLILLETKDKSTRDYKLFAVNLHNGCARWLYRFLSPLDSRPTRDGGVVWASSVSTIYALDDMAGAALSKTKVKFTVSSPIHAVGRRLYIGTVEHAVYALGAADPYPDWNFGTFGPITAIPLVDGHRLFVASEDGTFYAFDFGLRDNMWQVRTGEPITADPVQDENNVYFGSENFNVYCVSKATGRQLWKFPAQGPVRRPLLFMKDDTLLVKGDGSCLYALDKATGEEKWRDADAIHPVALGRRLYVTTNDTIKALDPGTGAVSWEQSLHPFAFVPINLTTDAITLCTADGQVFLIQEKSGMSLQPPEEVARAQTEAEATAPEE